MSASNLPCATSLIPVSAKKRADGVEIRRANQYEDPENWFFISDYNVTLEILFRDLDWFKEAYDNAKVDRKITRKKYPPPPKDQKRKVKLHKCKHCNKKTWNHRRQTCGNSECYLNIK